MNFLPPVKNPGALEWTLHIFRRHDRQETYQLMCYMNKNPWLTPSFMTLLETAVKGKCAKQCGGCTQEITSDDGYGGLVVLDAEIGDKIKALVTPLCTKCAHQNIDVLETRVVAMFDEHFFEGSMETDP